MSRWVASCCVGVPLRVRVRRRVTPIVPFGDSDSLGAVNTSIQDEETSFRCSRDAVDWVLKGKGNFHACILNSRTYLEQREKQAQTWLEEPHIADVWWKVNTSRGRDCPWMRKRGLRKSFLARSLLHDQFVCMIPQQLHDVATPHEGEEMLARELKSQNCVAEERSIADSCVHIRVYACSPGFLGMIIMHAADPFSPADLGDTLG